MRMCKSLALSFSQGATGCREDKP